MSRTKENVILALRLNNAGRGMGGFLAVVQHATHKYFIKNKTGLSNAFYGANYNFVVS
ncbi:MULTISPECIES: hypothetical protein [Enterobacter]|uniref:hypothetical protein n=1 Tax=Enterobacter TaxID=547 RepID=UPI0013D20FF4|nr:MULTISPECIES: hypothetical protein [Enterobacter]ELG9997059.1 hypothetical protein [Enterobacter cloacae]MBE3285613.1 hypothetical protein [Enterobacter cloacae complex sp. P31C]